jgi:hypothetical protein
MGRDMSCTLRKVQAFVPIATKNLLLPQIVYWAVLAAIVLVLVYSGLKSNHGPMEERGSDNPDSLDMKEEPEINNEEAGGP